MTTLFDRVPPPLHRSLHYVLEHALPLPIGAAVALLWANVSPVSYASFAHALEFPVNDIGMVFFFALAAKEVVEATAPGGALHTWRRAALPCIAAIGGMVLPALCYLAYAAAVGQPALARGWAIPCATDIAFSALVAKAIFRRHPAVPFLLLLAIADDALGLLILAVFYPAGDLNPVTGGVLLAAGMAAAFALKRRRVRNFWPYIGGAGTLAWFGLFQGGLHPALALVPVIPFVPHAARDPGLFVEAPANARDTLSEFEHWWKYPVQIVLFFFGLVNAGVELRAYGHGTWAVLGAILVGKPLGIGLAVAAAVLIGLRLPPRLNWRDVTVTGFAAGIGFTVALFFATAAFPAGQLLDEAKLGALLSVASAVAAFAAAAVLRVGRFSAYPAGDP
jgi:NhaA family Na+:H+ antiporter